MEAIDLPTLSRQLAGAHRFQRPAATHALKWSFRAAGSWLRLLHAMPPANRCRTRLGTRDDVVATMRQLVDYLRSKLGGSGFLDAVEDRFYRSAGETLPRQMPLVCGHGDFGLHNIFVAAADQRVLGFDTLAYWNSPLYEDVAYFLLLLDTMPPLFVNRDLHTRRRHLAAYRREFLAGYFQDQSPPTKSLWLFDMLAVLDKWVSATHSCQNANGMRAVGKKMGLALKQRMLRARLQYASGQLRLREDSQ